MDPFTRKLLERTQARRDALNAKLAQTPQPLPRKRRSPLKEENGIAPILSTVKEQITDDDSPGKRQCMETPCDDMNATKENNADSASVSAETNPSVKPAPRSNPRNDLPADHNVSNEETAPMPKSPNPRGRAGRLAALAANINKWEDDLPESNARSGPQEQQQQQQPVPKGRPPLESGSTPPMSTSGSSLSSSASNKTPSSDPVSSGTASKPELVAKVTSPSVVTPKLKLTDMVPALEKQELHSSASTNQAPIICLPSSIKQVVQQQQQQHSPTKKVVWDRAIVATLEAQGFVQSPSKTKLEYNFQKSKTQMTREGRELSEEESGDSCDEMAGNNKVGIIGKSDCRRQTTEVELKSVKDLAKKFDNPSVDPVGVPRKDPTELPLSARVALFEKNIEDAAPFPKHPILPFGQNRQAHQAVTAKLSNNLPAKEAVEQVSDKSPLSTGNVGKHTFELHKRLFEKVDKDWKSNEIATKISEDRQKDMAVVMNRWSYNKKVLEENVSGKGEKAVYTPLTSTVDNKENKEKESADKLKNNGQDGGSDGSNVKSERRLSQIPKPPPLPVISQLSRQANEPQEDDRESNLEGSSGADDEATDENQLEEDEDEEDEEEEEAEREDSDADYGQKAYTYYDNVETRSCSDEDDEKESEQEDGDSDENQDLDSSILQVAFKRIQSTKIHDLQPPQNSNPLQAISIPTSSTVEPVQDYNFRSPLNEAIEAPLLHTVSFYRRQKEMNKTPVKMVTRNEEVHSPPSQDNEDHKRFNLISEEECRAQVLDKMKALQEDANAQLIIMSQASQALNLCRSTAEFHGSAEQIEGERLLLISSQRRQACLNEIQRLKTDSALGATSNSLPAKKGSLTIGELKLTLKREFLSQTDNGKSGEFVHYFVCLVKHRGLVIATQMVSTLDGLSMGAFHLANLINVRELDHDFNILFEVYGLQTKRENINKERKILSSRKDKSKLTLTPKKKSQKHDSKLASPGIQSPGGPSAICSTSFSLIGFTMINIKSMKRTAWTLEKVPFVSPLDGNLHMKVQCHTDHHVDEQGFLTMFEDVSGFGAWHRRWFHLSHRYISYWKYPDDVKRKEPIGQIDLCQCVTSNVSLVPRDICARPHTLMMLTVRPPSKDDVDTLVSQNCNTYTVTKVLLSADTKDERIVWCQRFNDSLENLRMWNPNALKPIPSNSMT